MPRGIRAPFDSWDAVKLIALLLMVIDHSGAFFYTDEWWLRAIGRGTAPVFLFLGGYASSYRIKKEWVLLAVLMSISDYLLAGHLRTQNILYTIIACRLILGWQERRGPIKKPYEWFIGCIIWLPVTMFLIQYGSLGLLFALCGYMKRRSDYYPPQLQQRFWILTFVSYGIFSVAIAGFSPINTLLMSAVLYGVYRLLWQLELRNINTTHYPLWLVRLGKLVSYYSGYIYALHLIALEWVTGIPF